MLIVLEISERRAESMCRVPRNLEERKNTKRSPCEAKLRIIGLLSRDQYILASTHSIQRSKRRQ